MGPDTPDHLTHLAYLAYLAYLARLTVLMNIHDFLVPPAESARRKGPHDRIVMSSRVRLARNIKDAAFPGWAKKPERVRILDLIRPAIESLPEMRGAFSESMDNLSSLDKMILVERHLIS